MKEVAVKGGVMLVDDDFDMPKAYLRVDRGGYVIAAMYSHKENRCSKHSYMLVHRAIMKAQKGQIIDHVNHNKMDNRRCNLRVVNHAQSTWNRRRNGFTVLGDGKYRAQIKVDGKVIHIGIYATEDEARSAYQEAHRKHRGEFSPYRIVEAE